jgi:hypothetical protein
MNCIQAILHLAQSLKLSMCTARKHMGSGSTDTSTLEDDEFSALGTVSFTSARKSLLVTLNSLQVPQLFSTFLRESKDGSSFV